MTSPDRHLTAAVVTASDGVSEGTREDESGAALEELLVESGFDVTVREVVPDERDLMGAALHRLVGEVRLVVTTGGTGFGPRDVTPEATADIIEREAPGLAEAMRARGRESTPMADLSRGLVGSVGETLIVNLPGSRRGSVESLEAILDVIPHALQLLAGDTRHGHADEQHAHDGDVPEAETVEPEVDESQVELGPAQTIERGSGDVLDELARRRSLGEELVLATAVRVEGDPPCESGQRMLLGRTGPLAGTLGCSEFDGAATEDAPGVMDSGETVTRTYEHDLGAVEVQLEPHLKKPSLVVLGATPVALWLLEWARDLGFETVLVEPRTGRVTEEQRDSADHVVAGIGQAPLGGDSYVVHTDHDAHKVAQDLMTALTHEAAFVGLMGSRRHASEHLEQIREELGDEAADRVDTPVGLDLGGRTPQEIALSILAGVVAVRNGRGGGRLG